MDAETQKVDGHNKRLMDLVHSDGWKEARAMLVGRILELQNVAEYIDIIQTGNATKLLKEMKANKRAAEILFDWLRMIEGDAQTAADDKAPKKKSYIYNADDED